MKESNLSLRLTNIIGKDIINGTYPEQTELPTESEFCKIYDVSRTVLREAFKMLTAKGLVSARPRRGTRVQPANNWQLFDPDILSWLQSTRPSINLLKELTELRSTVEPQAAAYAAQKCSKSSLDRLEKAVDATKTVSDGLSDPLESKIEFHMALLHASENRFFIQLSAAIETALRFSVLLTKRSPSTQTESECDLQTKILFAVRNQQMDVAKETMSQILQEVEQLIEENMAAKLTVDEPLTTNTSTKEAVAEL